MHASAKLAMQPEVQGLFLSAHQEALSLDVGVIQKILRTNAAAQRRTKYFQRLDMAYRSLQKHDLLVLFSTYQQLTKDVTEVAERKKKQKKRAEIFWDFAPLKGSETSQDNQDVQQLIQLINRIKDGVGKGIPEVIGRMEYASDAFFREMARGFFLPLCSTAVAAIARIRILLKSLGTEILCNWSAVEEQMKEVFDKGTKPAISWDTAARRELQHKLTPSTNDVNSGQGTKEKARSLLSELLVTTLKDANIVRESELMEVDDKQKMLRATEVCTDLGERVTSRGHVDDKDEPSPDYIEAAVGHIQSNLALSRKAKKKKKREQSLPQSPGTPDVTNSLPGGDAKVNVEAPEKASNQGSASDLSPVKEKRKKKKRKEGASASKSSKKAKSSGDFFDNLFSK